MTFTTKKTGAVHLHPAAAVERQERREFERLWFRLNLHLEVFE
jgi:hypothetical protein